jgi:hypothetical protein
MEGNGADRLKFRFYFWFNDDRCIVIENASKSCKTVMFAV